AQPGSGAVVTGDGTLLERLVANLVENGVRHNHADGWVDVRVGVSEAGAFVRVENTGDVIAPAMAARLLEPFQRMRRRADGGAGLGLSIVRTVAAAHGGTVGVEPRGGGGLIV